MRIHKLLRTVIGANLMIILTFAFLPALLINPDIDVFQTVLNYIAKE